jgi:hypothetical protein
MRDPLSRDFSSLQPSRDSWLHRVRDNFHQLLTPARISPSSANGAPIHVLKLDASTQHGRSQSFSFLTHAMIISTLVLLAAHPPAVRGTIFRLRSQRSSLSHCPYRF